MHFHLGMAYLDDGNFPKAQQSLKRALELQPDFPGAADARKALAQIGG